MGKGRKTGGRDFKPGNTFSVGHGRPKLPEDIKQARKMNQIEFERIANKLMQLSVDDLIQFINNKENSTVEVFVGKLLAEGIKSADSEKLNFFLQRMGVAIPAKDGGNNGGKLQVSLHKEFIDFMYNQNNDGNSEEN